MNNNELKENYLTNELCDELYEMCAKSSDVPESFLKPEFKNTDDVVVETCSSLKKDDFYLLVKEACKEKYGMNLGSKENVKTLIVLLLKRINGFLLFQILYLLFQTV